MTIRKYKIGTRKSKLALAQTEEVIAEIKKSIPDFVYEIVSINTKGDQVHHKPLRELFEGGKSAFTSELQQALKEKEIDIAVHSMKDVAGNVREETLTFGAFLKRRSASDVFISRNFIQNIESLPQGFIVGTVSLRRKAALLKLNNKVKVRNLRGSIQTRIAKLRHEFIWDDHPPILYDGIVMAEAALERSDKNLTKDLYILKISESKMVPAACQGTIGVECRKDDHETYRLLRKINHVETEEVSLSERDFLYMIGGNCHTSVGVYCYEKDKGFEMSAEISDEKGKIILDEILQCEMPDISSLPKKLAAKIIEKAQDKLGENYKEILNIEPRI